MGRYMYVCARTGSICCHRITIDISQLLTTVILDLVQLVKCKVWLQREICLHLWSWIQRHHCSLTSPLFSMHCILFTRFCCSLLCIFRSTPLSWPNKACLSVCISVRTYVRPQKVSPIQMKFGMLVRVTEWCTMVCHVARSKVKVKVSWHWRLQILPFSKFVWAGFFYIFPSFYRASAVAASPVLATIGMSVCLSVRPSHAGTEWKRRKLGSRNLHRRIAQWL